MKPYKDALNNLIRIIKNKKNPSVYDVELTNIQDLKKFHSIECHFVLYPFSRNICSKNMKFNPYEEYVKDIQAGGKSVYLNIKSRFNELFGLILGGLIFLFFYIFNKSGLTSIESVISILGAYFLGKDLWDDIEQILINTTKNFFFRYIENYYSYLLLKRTTMTQYSYLAKKIRYEKETILPEKMDLIEQSNSETVRMFFYGSTLKKIKVETAHVLSIHLDRELIRNFEKEGYMLGVKASFNRRFLLWINNYEFFQSIVRDERGCLDKKGVWYKDSAFYRRTITSGRIKIFLFNIVKKSINLIQTGSRK